MSHRITAKVSKFRLDAVKKTLDDMGVHYIENGVWKGWMGRDRQPCDVLVDERSNGLHYGIGFREVEGELEIVHESMASSQERGIISDFKRVYALNVAKATLSDYGYRLAQRADGAWEAHATAQTVQKLGVRSMGQAKQKQQQVTIGRY